MVQIARLTPLGDEKILLVSDKTFLELSVLVKIDLNL